jgi:thiamine-monophosphate kinase
MAAPTSQTMGEFDLIARYFTWPSPRATLGVGDDCALLQPSAGVQWAISSDMLVSGRHFFAGVDPMRLGHKALAVNLSDLAACGATPRAFTLALALPEIAPDWLEGFSRGLRRLADTHQCELVGGDTTQGPLNICITVFGEVPNGAALLRSGAQVGDDIYISGTLGEAALGLQLLQGTADTAPTWTQAQKTRARDRLELPTPRVTLGLALRGIASAAADISDGLVGDLGHILKRSGVGATLHTANFPAPLGLPASAHLASLLAGGDDYELVFTAAPSQRGAVAAAGANSSTQLTLIGTIEAAPGLRLHDAQGQALTVGFAAFDHFSTLS